MKYKISGQMTVSCWTEVEANSEEEAIEIAQERDPANLCHLPFSEESDEAWHFDNDGEPSEFHIS